VRRRRMVDSRISKTLLANRCPLFCAQGRSARQDCTARFTRSDSVNGLHLALQQTQDHKVIVCAINKAVLAKPTLHLKSDLLITANGPHIGGSHVEIDTIEIEVSEGVMAEQARGLTPISSPQLLGVEPNPQFGVTISSVDGHELYQTDQRIIAVQTHRESHRVPWALNLVKPLLVLDQTDVLKATTVESIISDLKPIEELG